jgi:hypothetical protein
MQADVFTRVVLVLILGCLVALVARDYSVGDEGSPNATRGRYSITMARQGGDFMVLRTDTHEGEVARTLLKAGGPWQVLGEPSMEEATPITPPPAPLP